MREFTGYKRGINLGGWLSQCDHSPETYNTFITESDLDRIAAWGLDHVRLPIDYELIEAEDGRYLEEGFRYIENCLAWCKKNALNLILDLHKTAGYSFDELETSTGFFYNDKLQSRFTSLWVELARRFGGFSDRLAFELLNEIVDSDVAAIWNDIAKRTIIAIRQYAPTIKLLLGGVRNNSIDALMLLELPYDDNIVYNFHFYEPLIFTHQAAYWVKKMTADFRTVYPNTIAAYRSESETFLPEGNGELYHGIAQDKIDTRFFEAAFSEAIQLAKERGVALYCGEYGVIDQADLSSTLSWYSDIHQVFEKYGIGRAAWTYKGKDFGIIDEHYAPIHDKLIELL